jgi:hypothetical protein
MADYAGAVAAIKARFVEFWKTGDDPKTPISFQNEAFADQTGPWVYFEVIGNGSTLRGVGTPGSHVWLYRGLISIHIFVPDGSGPEVAHTLAVTAGEIFRAKQFYNDALGCCVRTGIGPDGEGPRTDGGASDADNGNWWRVTCTVPFEFYYRG